MNRRTLLRSSSLLAVAALAACSATTTATVSAQVATDVNLIATGLQPILAQLTMTVSATVLATIAQEVALIQAAAPNVIAGIADAAAAPSVASIGSAFQAILTALSGFSLPAMVTSVLSAVQTLLPIIQLALGLAIAVAASPRKLVALTPTQARAVLAGS